MYSKLAWENNGMIIIKFRIVVPCEGWGKNYI